MKVKCSKDPMIGSETEIIETETEVILMTKFQGVSPENLSVTLIDPVTVELSFADPASFRSIYSVLAKRDAAVKDVYARVMQQATRYYAEHGYSSPESVKQIQLPTMVQMNAVNAGIEKGVLKIVFQKEV